MEGEIETVEAIADLVSHDEVDPDRKATYSEVFASRAYTVMFASKFSAIVADTLRIVALSVLIYSVSGSSLLSALSFGIGFMPQVLGTSLLGAISDVYRTKPRLLIAEAIEIVTVVPLAFTHMSPGWMLVILGANAAITPPLSSPARLQAALLKGDAFVLGRSLMNISGQVAQLVGLGISGFVVAGLGDRHALIVCGALHVVTFIGLLFMRVPAGVETVVPRGGSLLGSSVRGQRAILASRHARRLLAVQWLPPLCAAMAESLFVSYCLKNDLGEHASGLLMAASPVGLVIGGVLVGRGFAPRTRERIVPLLILLLGAPLIGFFWSPPLVVSIVLVVISTMGFGFELGVQRQFVEAVPEDQRGLSFALLGSGMMTVQGLGSLAGGGLSEAIGIGPAIGVSGVLTMMIALWWLVIRSR